MSTLRLATIGYSRRGHGPPRPHGTASWVLTFEAFSFFGREVNEAAQVAGMLR